MTPTKESNKAPVTDLKDMENYKLSEKECKMTNLKKLHEMRENTYKHLNEIRKTMHKQKGKFNK